MKKLLILVAVLIFAISCGTTNQFKKRSLFPIGDVKEEIIANKVAYTYEIASKKDCLPLAVIKKYSPETSVIKDVYGDLQVNSPKTYIPKLVKNSFGNNLKLVEVNDLYISPERINSKEDMEEFFQIKEIDGDEYFVLENLSPTKNTGWAYFAPVEYSSFKFMNGKVYFQNSFGIYVLSLENSFYTQNNFLELRKKKEAFFKKRSNSPKLNKKYRYHFVKKGDSVWSICKMYGIDIKTFLCLNPEINRKTYLIKIGQCLRIK